MMMRFGVWLAKHHEIATTNSRMLNYTLGHNQFSDMTLTEFREQVLCSITPLEWQPEEVEVESAPMGGSKDWTNSGFVAPVKN